MINLSGIFGMYEMEKAASKILEIIELEGRCTFSPSDFIEPGDFNYHTLNGFAELLYADYLSHAPIYNGNFQVTDSLIYKLKRTFKLPANIESIYLKWKISQLETELKYSLESLESLDKVEPIIEGD